MKKIMNRQVLYLNEALLVAYDLFSDRDYKIIDFDGYSINTEEFYEKYPDVSSYYDKLVTRASLIKDDYKELEDLFYLDEEGRGIFNIIIYSVDKSSIRDYRPEEFRDFLVEFLEKNTQAMYGLSEDFADDLDLLEAMDHLDVRQKYSLLKLLKNHDSFLEKFCEFLAVLEDIIREEVNSIMASLNKLADELEKEDVLAWGGMESMRENDFIKNARENNYFLFIHSRNFVALSLDIEDGGILASFVGFIPYLLKEYKLNLEVRKDQIFEKISLLSDSTRFNIIYLLAKETLYGKEISDRLGISKGTISMHLNSLLEKDLLTMRIEGRRVYYSLNRKGFDEIMSYFEDLLGVHDGKDDAKDL